MSLPIQKLSQESIKQFKIRICQSKENLNLTWNEIAQIVNSEAGTNYGESAVRKWFSAWREGFDDGLESSQSEVLNEIKNEQIELQKLKYQTQDQRREYNKSVREQSRIDHLKTEMFKAIADLAKHKPLEWRQKEFDTSSNKEATLLLSDWHYGLFANNYWNKFDNNEFYRRLNKLINATIAYGKQHQVKVLHVFLLGDLINGLIHLITRINNTEDAITQTKKVSEAISEMLVEFANEFDVIKVYNCRGNHDRVTPNKKDEIAKESFNDLIPWYLEARLSHAKNIDIVDNQIDDEIITTDVCGYKVFAVHGHKDKVQNVVQNLTLMTKQFADYIFMGHTHHHEENEVHGVEVVVNSTLSGVDEYAKDIRATSKAAQKLIIFDEKESRLCTYSIRLDN